jgi:hypothetical protein
MDRYHYSPDQTAWLRRFAPGQPLRQTRAAYAARFGSAPGAKSLRSKLKNLGIPIPRAQVQQPKKLWTLAAIAYIREHARQDTATLAAGLARVFGLAVTPDQVAYAMRNHKIRTGRTATQFRPGNRPWNAGTQGLKGPSATSFRPGNVPANRQPLGYIRAGHDGVLEIKVAQPNPYTGSPTRFVAMHRHLWEQANGPVPAGHVITFRDGDHAHTDLDNLDCVPRATLARLNQAGHGDLTGPLRTQALELAKLRTGISRARRQIAQPAQATGVAP